MNKSSTTPTKNKKDGKGKKTGQTPQKSQREDNNPRDRKTSASNAAPPVPGIIALPQNVKVSTQNPKIQAHLGQKTKVSSNQLAKMSSSAKEAQKNKASPERQRDRPENNGTAGGVNDRARRKETLGGGERAKADAIIASTSSQWYAGAAFDRSPDAESLPRPSKLFLSKSPTSLRTLNTSFSRPVAEDEAVLATSCPPSTHLCDRSIYDETPKEDGPRMSPLTGDPCQTEDLQAKSRDLLNMLRGGPSRMTVDHLPSSPSISSSSGDKTLSKDSDDGSNATRTTTLSKDLEEMTLHVRKLLNLS